MIFVLDMTRRLWSTASSITLKMYFHVLVMNASHVLYFHVLVFMGQGKEGIVTQRVTNSDSELVEA